MDKYIFLLKILALVNWCITGSSLAKLTLFKSIRYVNLIRYEIMGALITVFTMLN